MVIPLLIRMSIHMRTGFLLLLLDTGLDRSPVLVFSSWAISGVPVNLNFNYFFAGILKPFLENVIRDFVLDTKRLEKFSMRQSFGLVLKVKPFKIFT